MTPTTEHQTVTDEWFDELVSQLRTHQLMLKTDTASEELKQFYETVSSSDINELLNLNRKVAQKHFVSKIIVDYLKLLEEKMPRKLAFDFNDKEVLVWAETDNDVLEKELFLSEAQINAKYHPFGFDMTSTIVESSDQLPIPNHYKIFKS